MEVSFLFIHCMTNSFTFLNMQRFTLFYPQSYPQSKYPPHPPTPTPYSLHQRKVFSVNLPLVNHFPLPRRFYLFIFPQTHYRIFKVVYQFHCLSINESTVPNANVYFDCFRTWVIHSELVSNCFSCIIYMYLIAYITTS